MKFEGFRPACEYAEINSKKESCEMIVVKTMTGGILYDVVRPTVISGRKMLLELKPNETVLAHYKNGLIVTA